MGLNWSEITKIEEEQIRNTLNALETLVWDQKALITYDSVSKIIKKNKVLTMHCLFIVKATLDKNKEEQSRKRVFFKNKSLQTFEVFHGDIEFRYGKVIRYIESFEVLN